MGKFKSSPPPLQKGNHIRQPEPVNYDARPVIFSLERIQSGEFSFDQLAQEDKAQFAEAIYRRRDLTWANIKKTDRHGLGFEKIAKTAIRTGLPVFVAEDLDHFLAFRYNGLRAMVGYRIQDVFYVLWFDHKFKLYAH